MVGCEICGKEAGQGKKIRTDGCEMIVCEDCASFGIQVKEKRNQDSSSKSFSGKGMSAFSQSHLVDDYGKRIRQAREKQGWTLEDLGKKVFEKSSYVHRVEAQQIKPSDKLAKKLEDCLGISLGKTGSREENDFEAVRGEEKGITLWDIAKKKKGEEE